MSTATATPQVKQREAQALVTVLHCGSQRGLAAVKLLEHGEQGSEYFIPFRLSKAGSELERQIDYAGFIAALDRLRALKLHRLLVLTDDTTLVNELERAIEPPRELFLQYVILGCKLNEFGKARVVVAPSSRLETLRAKAASLAATIYQTPEREAGKDQTALPLASGI